MRNYIEQNENLASSKDTEVIGMEDKIKKLEAENRDLLETIKKHNKESRSLKSKYDDIESEKQEYYDKCLALEVRNETLESKNKDYSTKTVSLQDKCADQTLQVSDLKNALRLAENEMDILKKDFFKEQQVRKETENTLEEIQREALMHNNKYAEQMGMIKKRIESLKQVEKDQSTRITQLEIEKNQFLGVINSMQHDHQNQVGRITSEIDSKNDEIKRLLEEVTN